MEVTGQHDGGFPSAEKLIVDSRKLGLNLTPDRLLDSFVAMYTELNTPKLRKEKLVQEFITSCKWVLCVLF